MISNDTAPVPMVFPSPADMPDKEELLERARNIAEKMISETGAIGAWPDLECSFYSKDLSVEAFDGKLLYRLPDELSRHRFTLAAALKTVLKRSPKKKDGLYPVMTPSMSSELPGSPELLVDERTAAAFVLAVSDVDYMGDGMLSENAFLFRAMQRKSGTLPFALVPVLMEGEGRRYRLVAVTQPGSPVKPATLDYPIVTGEDFSDLPDGAEVELELYDIAEGFSRIAVPFELFVKDMREMLEDDERTLTVEYAPLPGKEPDAPVSLEDFSVKMPYRGVQGSMPLSFALPFLSRDWEGTGRADANGEKPAFMAMDEDWTWFAGYRRRGNGSILFSDRMVLSSKSYTQEAPPVISLGTRTEKVPVAKKKKGTLERWSLYRKGADPNGLDVIRLGEELAAWTREIAVLDKLLESIDGDDALPKSKKLAKMLKVRLGNALTWKKILEGNLLGNGFSERK